MEYLLGAIALLVGGLLIERKKRQSAEALLENQKTKEQIQSIQKNVDVNNASIVVEEQKREDIKKASAEELAKVIAGSDLLKFLNRKE